MANDICKACGNNCEVDCVALDELRKIYAETRLQEKRALIRILKHKIDIADAQPSKEMEQLAEKVIAKIPDLHFISNLNIKIGYVTSYEKKRKSGQQIYGDCRKVNPVYSAFLPFDFIITFYEPNIGHLSPNQAALLMWHELKHVGIGQKGFTIIPHDIEDFHSIIDTHGTRWNEFGTDVTNILE